MKASAANRHSGVDTTCPKPGQHALYRFYDASEELLYVGISNEPWRRRKQHSTSQPWYPQVRYQSVTWYDSEREARHSEIAAIRQERPHFNVAGAIRPPRARLSLHVPTMTAASAMWVYAGPALACLTVGFPALRTVLIPCVVIACLTSVPAVAATCAVAAGPHIRRFGAWLERNTVRSAGRRRRALAVAGPVPTAGATGEGDSLAVARVRRKGAGNCSDDEVRAAVRELHRENPGITKYAVSVALKGSKGTLGHTRSARLLAEVQAEARTVVEIGSRRTSGE